MTSYSLDHGPTPRYFHLDDPALGAHAPLHPVHVPTGTLLTEAAHTAGVEITQPCGGQGRCGRCAVHVTKGEVRRRSTLRLTAEDVAAGYALACQSVVEGDVVGHGAAAGKDRAAA